MESLRWRTGVYYLETINFGLSDSCGLDYLRYEGKRLIDKPPLTPSQLTGTIPKKTTGGKNEQVLDKLKVERERGITGQIGELNNLLVSKFDLFFV